MIRAASKEITNSFLPSIWTSEIPNAYWAGSIATNGKNVSTSNDDQPADIFAWTVDVSRGRETIDLKSKIRFMVLVRDIKVGA